MLQQGYASATATRLHGPEIFHASFGHNFAVLDLAENLARFDLDFSSSADIGIILSTRSMAAGPGYPAPDKAAKW